MAPKADDTMTRTECKRLDSVQEQPSKSPELPIVWRNVAVQSFLHLGALYGVYRCFYSQTYTLLFGKPQSD